MDIVSAAASMSTLPACRRLSTGGVKSFVIPAQIITAVMERAMFVLSLKIEMLVPPPAPPVVAEAVP